MSGAGYEYEPGSESGFDAHDVLLTYIVLIIDRLLYVKFLITLHNDANSHWHANQPSDIKALGVNRFNLCDFPEFCYA